jgi:hypothetical protein
MYSAGIAGPIFFRSDTTGGLLKISAKMSVVMAAIFAAICFSVAITGFSSIGDITDPVQKSDGLGFAWFWTFLGVVAVVFGLVGIWIVRTHKEGEDV